MISKGKKKVDQVQIVSLDQLVPKDHLLRKINNAIDFNFIYDLVKDKYSKDKGRPSIDPVTLIKIPIIQYMFGIKSMRQTIKDIEVNVAYRWFLGLGFYDDVPHFSTFGKNYKRRFEGTDLFEQIFAKILMQCMNHKLVNTDEIFVDATHVKAAANRKKAKKILVAKKSAKFYDKKLKEEIDADRIEHGKKPFNDNDSNDSNSDNFKTSSQMKEQKQSTTDPESGWFHKGEHKEVFAYSIETACDKHGWILDYTVHPGNEHDSTTFPYIYDKLKKLNPKHMILDAGYKTPPITKMLIDDNITPILPYTRPHGSKELLKKKDFKYDKVNDVYVCPNNQILNYSTTNRDGYKEYKSCKKICSECKYLKQCTKSKSKQKVITRHIWEEYLEYCEKIRLEEKSKELYSLRKETIERCFGTAKEHHAMRYTQQIGKKKMQVKIALTFACMNMKKLALILFNKGKSPHNSRFFSHFTRFLQQIFINFLSFA